MAPSVAEQAAFYRAALWLGLVRGREVTDWADGLLARATDPPAGLVDLATVHEHDVTALRHALLALGPERTPWPVAQAVLGLVARQLASGRRSFHDTRTVLWQARQGLALPSDAAETLKQFELAGLLAGSAALPAEVEAGMRAWLASFAGADAAFTPGR